MTTHSSHFLSYSFAKHVRRRMPNEIHFSKTHVAPLRSTTMLYTLPFDAHIQTRGYPSTSDVRRYPTDGMRPYSNIRRIVSRLRAAAVAAVSRLTRAI